MLELDVIQLFALVLTRFSGLMVTAPFFGSGNFPMTARAGFAFVTAIIITPVLPSGQVIPDVPLAFAIVAAQELIIGMILGFIMTLTFSAIQVGGQIIDMQTGFGMMNVFNPALEVQFPIFGFFLFIIAVLYLLVIRGHHVMIRALVATYEHVPIGQLSLDRGLLYQVPRWGSEMFIDGLMIAAPIAAAMLLAYVTMGLLGRVVPQIHLFVIGFPITMAAGILLIALMLGAYISFIDGMFARMFRHVETAVFGMS